MLHDWLLQNVYPHLISAVPFLVVFVWIPLVLALTVHVCGEK